MSSDKLESSKISNGMEPTQNPNFVPAATANPTPAPVPVPVPTPIPITIPNLAPVPPVPNKDASPSASNKTLLALALVLLIAAGGYWLYQKYGLPEGLWGEKSMVVEVASTPATNGVIPMPAGFPQGIPFEGIITESATTRYPEQNATQLSVSFQTPKTIDEKYAEYKAYLSQAGYIVTEGEPNAPAKSLFGTKMDANLSVVVSSPDGITLVQLSYLLK
ncbi:MAG: hypothetical protein Q7S54_00260 [bacterium]|nr:hypothetical protein [bacterium]